MRLEMLVGSLMTSDVTTCKEDASLKNLVETVTSSGVSCVVVVSDKKPVGIVTERDLVRLFHAHLEGRPGLPELAVTEFMSPSPLTVEETTPLFDALVLTQTSGFRHLPVVNEKGCLIGILTFSDLARTYEQVFDRQKKVMEKEVGSKTRQLEEINEHLTTLSMKDALLKIGNRRAMEVDINHTHRLAEEQGRDYSLVLFDVDHFKQFNDCYGHQAGDKALVQIVNTIKESIRSKDRLYRYGGEEILLLMVDTTIDMAAEIANRSVRALRHQGFEHEKSPQGILTMSGGVSNFKISDQSDWTNVLANADTALYQAKSAGRNQVVVCTDCDKQTDTGTGGNPIE